MLSTLSSLDFFQSNYQSITKMLSLLELTVTTREMRCKPVLLDCVRFSLLPLTVLEIEIAAIAQPEPEPEPQPEPQPEQTAIATTTDTDPNNNFLVQFLGKNWDNKEQMTDITTAEAIQCKANALQMIDEIRANGFTGVSVTTASAAKRNLSKYQKTWFLKKIGYPNPESLTLPEIHKAIELVSTYVTAWYAVSFYNIPGKKS